MFIFVDVFVVGVFFAEDYLSEESALNQEAQGAVYGGLGDPFAALADVQQEVFGLKVLVALEDPVQEGLSLGGKLKPFGLQVFLEFSFMGRVFAWSGPPWSFATLRRSEPATL